MSKFGRLQDPNKRALNKILRENKYDPKDPYAHAGEEEPKGKFTVLARTKTGWKNISSSEGSNKAFRHAQNLANKYQDREFGVRWPNGQLISLNLLN